MVMDMRRAKLMGSIVSFLFMLIHISLLYLFIKYDIKPMARVNVVSVLFYAFLVFSCQKGWLRFFAVGIYMEVAIHMFLAILYTGWDSGFQYTTLGMNVVGLYSEYVGRSLKIKHVIPMLPFGLVGLGMYLSSYVIVQRNGSPYSLPENINFILNIIWGIVTVSITLTVIKIFIMIVESTEKKLEFQLSHDQLTGLPNRYHFSNRINEIQVHDGLDNYWLGIFDLDGFKQINDTYGHNCGDYVLSTLGDIIRSKNVDNCCRWGGEEFILILKFDTEDKAFDYFDDIRKDVEKYDFRYNGFSFNVTITVGIALYKDDLGTDAWISEADGKLYIGKKNGKNQVVR